MKLLIWKYTKLHANGSLLQISLMIIQKINKIALNRKKIVLSLKIKILIKLIQNKMFKLMKT